MDARLSNLSDRLRRFAPGLAVLWLVILAVSCRERVRTVTIDNAAPRRDVNGQIIDAHDGCLQLFGGRFYLYGTAYGTNSGYTQANRYRVYSSPDLEHWTLAGDLFPQQPAGVYYRPYVVYNSFTFKYVLWYNWNPDQWHGCAGVAISDRPTGPFTIVNTNVSLSSAHPGDGSLFVDDDGTAYYTYTATDQGYNVRVERLTPDYLRSAGDVYRFDAFGFESPVLFRRGSLYYLLFGRLCAFCPGGSEISVHAAVSPLGPFEKWTDFNRRTDAAAPVALSNQTYTVNGPNGSYTYSATNNTTQANAPVVPAQETWVAKIPTPGGPVFMWMADRWQSAPDGVKGHDLQFWTPLQFSSSDQAILPVENTAQWSITVDLQNRDQQNFR